MVEAICDLVTGDSKEQNTCEDCRVPQRRRQERIFTDLLRGLHILEKWHVQSQCSK